MQKKARQISETTATITSIMKVGRKHNTFDKEQKQPVAHLPGGKRIQQNQAKVIEIPKSLIERNFESLIDNLEKDKASTKLSTECLCRISILIKAHPEYEKRAAEACFKLLKCHMKAKHFEPSEVAISVFIWSPEKEAIKTASNFLLDLLKENKELLKQDQITFLIDLLKGYEKDNKLEKKLILKHYIKNLLRIYPDLDHNK